MYQLNGIGTTLLGKADKFPDGSYIATKWFTIAFLPLYPLGSYRVYKKEGMNLILYADQKVYLQKVDLQKSQVIKTYCIWWGGGVVLLLLLSAFST